MELDKQQVLDLIKSKAGPDLAQQAEKELPDSVNPEQHADLLKKFGVNPDDLMGDLGGKLGL